MTAKHWLWLAGALFGVWLSTFIFWNSTSLIFLVAVFAWTYFVYNDIIKEKEVRLLLLEEKLNNLPDFTPTSVTRTDLGYVAYDDKVQQVQIVEEGRHESFHFNDVISTEVVNESITINRNSKASFLTRGFFGALFGGRLGMVVSASGMKQKNVTLNSSMSLKVTLNSMERPFVYIVFLNSRKGVSKNSDYYQKSQKDLEYWKGVLDVIKTNQSSPAPTKEGVL